MNFLPNRSSIPHKPIATSTLEWGSKRKRIRKNNQHKTKQDSKHGFHPVCGAPICHAVLDIVCSCLSDSWKASFCFLALLPSFRTAPQHSKVSPLSRFQINPLCFPKRNYWAHHPAWRHLSRLYFKSWAVALPEGERLSSLNYYRKQKSLGSCSSIRITLSVYLKSEQYGLLTPDNLGKLVWASGKSKHTTIKLIHIKGQLSTPRINIFS